MNLHVHLKALSQTCSGNRSLKQQQQQQNKIKVSHLHRIRIIDNSSH